MSFNDFQPRSTSLLGLWGEYVRDFAEIAFFVPLGVVLKNSHDLYLGVIQMVPLKIGLIK